MLMPSVLLLQGARWDAETRVLAESRPKELFTDMPVLLLRPVEDRPPNKALHYVCPVYKTLTRAGAWRPRRGVWGQQICCCNCCIRG